MRKLVFTVALVAGAATPAVAQTWRPEIGLRASFTRFDDPNSDAYIDMIDLPGVGGWGAAGVSPSALYGVVPLGGRLAIQPSFGFSNIAINGVVFTAISAGARLNMALTNDFYAGAGFNAYIGKQVGFEDTQGAIELALGYQRTMGGHFRTTAEAFYEKREKSEGLPELNAYGVRLGAGYTFAGTGARPQRAGRQDRSWSPAIAIQGGWTLTSFPDVLDFTSFTLPFVSQSAVVGEVISPGPAALTVILPVGERMAVEPSFNYHRYKTDTGDPVASYGIGARVDYALNGSAYAAAGLEYNGLSANGVDDGSTFGPVLAAGFRFPLAGALQGRTELSFRWFDGSDLFPAGQATSFGFGILVPVH